MNEPRSNRTPAAPEVYIASSQSAMRVPRKRIGELVAFVARSENRTVREVDIAVVDSAHMAALNRQWRGRRGTTDVLSFDLTDPLDDALAAEIVVCGPVAAEQAPRHGHGPQRELMLYVVHGLLHLLGYDDDAPDRADVMHAREEELLDRFLGGPRSGSPTTSPACS